MKGKHPDQMQKRTDFVGDALPDGAIARFGTIRWRFPGRVNGLKFLDNGKHVIVCNWFGAIHVVDSTTGKRAYHFGSTEGIRHTTISNDGTIAAEAFTFDKSDAWHPKIQLWNMANGERICSIEHDFQIWGAFFIGQDRLVTWGQQNIRIWSVKNGKLLRTILSDEVSLPGCLKKKVNILQLGISSDGTKLAFVARIIDGDDDRAPKLHLWDLNQEKAKHVLAMDQAFGGAVMNLGQCLSHHGNYLAWPDRFGSIHLYKSATMEKLRSISVCAADKKVCALNFSPDGKILAVMDNDETICLFEVDTGKFLRAMGERVRGSLSAGGDSTMAWSPDCKRLAQSWGPCSVRIWDVERGKENDVGTGHTGPITGLFVSSNRKTVYTLAEDTVIRFWDVGTVKQLQEASLPPKTKVAYLLGAKSCLLCNDNELSIWDLEKMQESIKLVTDFCDFELSDDSSFIRIIDLANKSAWYDLRSGEKQPRMKEKWTKQSPKQTQELESIARGARHTIVTIWCKENPKDYQLFNAFRIIQCRSFEGESGILWERKDDRGQITRPISFTPDDRAILTEFWSRTGGSAYLCLLETLTGKERYRFPFPFDCSGRQAFAFSAKGGLLALSARDGSTLVFDISRSKEVCRLNGGQGAIRNVVLDGQDFVFTGGSDGTVLMWDIRNHIEKSSKETRLTSTKLARAWAETGSADSVGAHRAVGDLVTAQNQAVEFLGKKITPAKNVTTAEIDKLVANLGSAEYTTREMAFASLRQIGTQAKSRLIELREKSESIEHRRRIEQLLDELKAIPLHELRDIRVIEVLEAIATREARTVLESLARGAPGTRLTNEASRAVARMNRQK